MPRTLQFSSDNEEDMDQFELELDGGDNFSPFSAAWCTTSQSSVPVPPSWFPIPTSTPWPPSPSLSCGESCTRRSSGWWSWSSRSTLAIKWLRQRRGLWGRECRGPTQ
eukprot:GFUD01052529.1.p2 GENE.GFUD01052529.1~~GFUD01052529.1.p2  ORF type:complete len:108 (-),score=26.45 GFUD01052529.1:100-423(-)